MSLELTVSVSENTQLWGALLVETVALVFALGAAIYGVLSGLERVTVPPEQLEQPWHGFASFFQAVSG